MTLRELLVILEDFDPELPVCFPCHSEWVEMEPSDVMTKELCKPRGDGWIQAKRPDQESIKYLVLGS